MAEIITAVIASINEILATGIVIIAVSMLLYNLTSNLNNRVARSSGVVLACVTFAYICDIFISLGPDPQTEAAVLRIQWVGIAFIPAALFHLSDALLATTGLPSRGRRRAVSRMLYALSGLFLIAAAFSDAMIEPVIQGDFVRMEGNAIFYIYILYFIVAAAVTFYNVQRARKRCLTAGTRRRMGYLQAAILTPALGILPYSAFLSTGEELSLLLQILVNIANIVVITMLVFLSYPLSFFGSDVPDRVVKVELLRFLLRGPGTAIIALATLIFTRRGGEILSLPAQEFIPFAVVAVVLLWQWTIHLALPTLEQFLVYRDEDDEQLAKLQDLSDRMLTRGDLEQLISATLEAFCDYLRTENAFAVSLSNGHLTFAQTIGSVSISEGDLNNADSDLRELADDAERVAGRSAFQTWNDYQIVPLYSKRATTTNGSTDRTEPMLIGIMGVNVSADKIPLDNNDDADIVYTFVQRAEQTLDDILLQEEIFAALEGLLPQIRMTRGRAEEVEYRPGRGGVAKTSELPDEEEAYEQVRAALRHYWGGPGISRSRLLDLNVVRETAEHTDTPVHALREVLQNAIDRLKPDGERSMMGVEWTFYNILDLRFLEREKVRDAARRMSMSESDFYRKQRAAIEAVASTILEMEKETVNPKQPS